MKKLIVLLAFVGLVSVSVGAAKKKSRFEKLELFNKVLFLVESQYYRDVDVEKLIQGAIRGMMNTLDPHSTFLDEDVFAKMQEDTKGEFGGLGIEVQQKDGVIVIVTPIDDTPAFKAGLMAGDKIVEIDGDRTIGLTLEEAVDKMRGKAGQKITIGILRAGVEGVKRYTLKRQIIKISPVKSKLIKDHYAYVRLTQFQKNSTSALIKALKKLRSQSKKKGGLKGIVLDLRNNPGGLLDQAVDVSSIFMKDGIVVSTEGRDPKHKEIRYVKKSGFKETELPVVVLVNGGSASASEIVAGALQDSKRAVVMGTQTFGKGSVQSVAKIDDVQAVKLTIAQYMTPSGRKIQAKGVTPDIEIDEFESEWVAENKKPSRFVREKDLRNHLTATIETKKEKEERLKREKEERKKRIELANRKKNTSSDKKKNQGRKRYNPATDYQVLRAVNFLKGYKLIEHMVKDKS
ncbi:MAG: S41 family peptidase [Oligoflexia bacterium]|nr:S41 family peptidase [Oligoflexia bacterium]